MLSQKKRYVLVDVLVLAVIYAVTYGTLFLSKAIMWDGWVWFSLLRQKDYVTFSWLLDQVRILTHMEIFLKILDRFGTFPFISNVVVFFCWLIAGLSIYATLTLLNLFRRESIFFIILCFLCIPIYIVRYEPTLITYTVSNCFFYVGVASFFWSRTFRKKLYSHLLNFFAAVSFVISFLTNSFLVYYGGFLLLLLLLFCQGKNVNVKLFLVWFKENILWILLPLLFYFWQVLFVGQPTGIYAGYNSFIFFQEGASIGSVTLQLISGAWESIANGFFAPYIVSVSILYRKIFAVLFVMVTSLLVLLNKKTNQFNSDTDGDLIHNKFLLLFGCILFIFGFSAYILVGEAPNLYGTRFDMRHGLILAFPASLITFALINLLFKNKVVEWIKIFVIGVFITYNFYNFFGIQMDYFKQQALTHVVKESFQKGQLVKNGIYVFRDNDLHMFNWRGRDYKTFDFTNILYDATQDKTLVGTTWGQNIDYILTYKKDPDLQNEKKLFERFIYVDVRSKHLSPVPTVFDFLRLEYAVLFNPSKLPDLYDSIFGAYLIFSKEAPLLEAYINK